MRMKMCVRCDVSIEEKKCNNKKVPFYVHTRSISSVHNKKKAEFTTKTRYQREKRKEKENERIERKSLMSRIKLEKKVKKFH